MQAEELPNVKEQEEHPGPSGNEQILSLLPQAHPAQRNEVAD